MPARARNLATTIALTCVMAVLLCLVQTASAVAAKSPEKTASGIFFADPNIYTGEIASESLQPQWEIAPATTSTASGRQVWLSADPLGEEGGLNLYGYVENDPVNLWDPLGLDPRCSLTTGIARAVKSGDLDALRMILQGLEGPAAASLRASITRLETPIGRLISATKKGSKSYRSELADETLAAVTRLKDTATGAQKRAAEQMLKLAEKGDRLDKKCGGKN